MTTTPAPVTTPSPFRFSHRQSLVLVFFCTLFGAAAQYLIKSSSMSMGHFSINALMVNYRLWAGLALYGISTILLILALRDGALSMLYPVISLTYVWVTLISVFAFHETITLSKGAGIAVICVGVALLGMNGESGKEQTQ